MVVAGMAAIMALFVAVPMVLAQGQGGAPEPVDEGPFLLPAAGEEGAFPGSCSFPVLYEPTGKSKTIELPNDQGLIITSPGLDATLTNTVTGTQETFNVTGTVRVLPLNEEGNLVTELRGRNLAIDPEAGFVVVAGNYSYTFDANGNLIEPLSGNGQLIDVCEALA